MPHKVTMSRSPCALINNLPPMLGCGIIFDSVSHPENQGTVPCLSCKDVVFTRECMQSDFWKMLQSAENYGIVFIHDLSWVFVSCTPLYAACWVFTATPVFSGYLSRAFHFPTASFKCWIRPKFTSSAHSERIINNNMVDCRCCIFVLQRARWEAGRVNKVWCVSPVFSARLLPGARNWHCPDSLCTAPRQSTQAFFNSPDHSQVTSNPTLSLPFVTLALDAFMCSISPESHHARPVPRGTRQQQRSQAWFKRWHYKRGEIMAAIAARYPVPTHPAAFS